MKKCPVYFNVKLPEHGKADDAKRGLEALSDDFIIFAFKSPSISYLAGETTQQAYESVFDAKLKYKTEIINANVGRPQKLHYWAEVKKAVVPESLQDLIESISISKPVHVCKR